MRDTWEELLSCAVHCQRCDKPLAPTDPRILSVYDHQAICLDCKRGEEQRSDYPETSKAMVGQCLMETEQLYGDPGGYCFHHFYPYRC